MKELLESAYKRKILLFLTGIVLALLFVLRYFVVPVIFNCDTAMLIPKDGDAQTKIVITSGTACPIASSILDNLIATISITIGVALLLYFLTPRVMTKANLKVIEPAEIKEYLVRATANASEWWFDGNTGRWTRAKTLPTFASAVRSENIGKHVHIHIIDPTNNIACQKYAEFRNSLRSAASQTWTATGVRDDICATIVSAYAWKHTQPRLEISIGLKNEFSLFRKDISSTLAVITREDPKEPAIYCDKGTFFYNSFLEDIKLSAKQIKILPASNKTFSPENATAASAKELLEELGIVIPELDDQDYQRIAGMVSNPTTPYE